MSKLAAGLILGALIIPGMALAQDKAPAKSTDKSAKQTAKDAVAEVKETVGDTAITTKIKAAYAKDKQVSALNIHVDTDQKGMVVLSGNAKTKAEADKAVSIAKGTQGVTSVKNDIKVAAAGTDTPKASTTAKGSANNPKADTRDSATADTRKAADTPKASTKSAKQTGKDAMAEVKETVSDTAITAKIKADFAKDKQVSALNIKVDTDQKGMVVLSGNAKSKTEADKAVSIAKATQGVTSVKNDIKVAP